jgi:hypothetical protein
MKKRVLATFDIRATSASLPAGEKPDELMLDWTALPPGSKASIYLPAISADTIVSTAGSMYGAQPFTRIDAHTVGCDAKGIAFLPIPPGSSNFAGLLAVELPPSVSNTAKYVVVVSQITNAGIAVREASARNWRKVLGTFQLGVSISTRTKVLPIAERDLSILRFILDATPKTSRWYPVMLRYVGAFADGVAGLGGNPKLIPPSATGTWPGWPGQGAGQGHPKAGQHEVTGKIVGLIFDHFGDFEGFILETNSGNTFTFYSREDHMRDVVSRAWVERLRVKVVTEKQDGQRVCRVVLYPPHGVIGDW